MQDGDTLEVHFDNFFFGSSQAACYYFNLFFVSRITIISRFQSLVSLDSYDLLIAYLDAY